AYLWSWLDVLKSDSRLVIVAAGQAQKAIDHICNEQRPGQHAEGMSPNISPFEGKHPEIFTPNQP
ncbi:MAG: hypothetical protein WB755_16015, partial [Terriglobales bacterium]